ncbi:hypothetical protein [Salinisphaera sp. G21_0]|uniref:hypothetical protein n=1 Tax=Salinisphaera sp. G21_0 TaxID=2821094 RepID=UPI001AD95F37|nr:hypothetical protein [Salinisphaera sp. G21_0]MBO9479942.1 hypothetical protein [Salinisphaera sp. G21_0]
MAVVLQDSSGIAVVIEQYQKEGVEVAALEADKFAEIAADVMNAYSKHPATPDLQRIAITP